ncbi:TPA: beta-carotene 15,15'-monooxygenase, partial [Streptococcus suis]
IISYKMKKMQEEAEKIFRKEVLRIHPVYANLKRCYVVGGETYKDKMLSNEKFLKVILWNEENSFYTWKTYENYSEYKNYRFKQFQKK